MKKIPSLFVRDWNGDRSRVTREVNPECQWVIDGEGTPTVKWDGTCVMVRGGQLYRRYDAKHGKTPPPAFEPAQAEPDPNTGHWPGWLPVGDEPGSKWHREAFANWKARSPVDGTYELCGPKFQSNPHGLTEPAFLFHGAVDIRDENPRDYDAIAFYLQRTAIEGIVWHNPDGRMAKIKRSDFGFEWPVTEAIRGAA